MHTDYEESAKPLDHTLEDSRDVEAIVSPRKRQPFSVTTWYPGT